MDVSLRLYNLRLASTSPVWISYNSGPGLASMVSMDKLERKEILKGFDVNHGETLMIDCNLPTMAIDPESGLGFVVGFRPSAL